MSIWGDGAQLFKDAWNGQESAGDAAKYGVDALDLIPGAGAFLPDGNEAKASVDRLAPPSADAGNGGGNIGNKIGTVVGGLAGPTWAADGSELGGWIADEL